MKLSDVSDSVGLFILRILRDEEAAVYHSTLPTFWHCIFHPFDPSCVVSCFGLSLECLGDEIYSGEIIMNENEPTSTTCIPPSRGVMPLHQTALG